MHPPTCILCIYPEREHFPTSRTEALENASHITLLPGTVRSHPHPLASLLDLHDTIYTFIRHPKDPGYFTPPRSRRGRRG